MFLGQIEQEIVCRYKPALAALGVDFNDGSVIDAIEDCNYELETRFQAVIAWYLYLRRKRKNLPNATYILVEAFKNEWQPIGWKQEFLELPQFQPPSALMREKLQAIDYFRYVSYEIKDNSNYVRFYYEGRMVWCLAIEDGLAMSETDLAFKFSEKSSV